MAVISKRAQLDPSRAEKRTCMHKQKSRGGIWVERQEECGARYNRVSARNQTVGNRDGSSTKSNRAGIPLAHIRETEKAIVPLRSFIARRLASKKTGVLMEIFVPSATLFTDRRNNKLDAKQTILVIARFVALSNNKSRRQKLSYTKKTCNTVLNRAGCQCPVYRSNYTYSVV